MVVIDIDKAVSGAVRAPAIIEGVELIVVLGGRGEHLFVIGGAGGRSHVGFADPARIVTSQEAGGEGGIAVRPGADHIPVLDAGIALPGGREVAERQAGPAVLREGLTVGVVAGARGVPQLDAGPRIAGGDPCPGVGSRVGHHHSGQVAADNIPARRRP